VKETVTDKVDTIKEKVGLAKGKAADTVSAVTPGGGGSSGGSSVPSPGAAVGTAKVKGRQALTTTRVKGRQAISFAKGNPLPLALGSLAVGALAGLLIPETQKEHETLGAASDNLKQAVTTTAQEAVQHGKEMAQTVASEVQATASQAANLSSTAASAASNVASAAQEHGQQVAQTAQEQAKQATPSSS